jgi:DNA modification methylase
MNPWKEKRVIGNATLYLGDCLEILPHLPKVDAVITDPPYPNFNSDHGKEWSYVPIEKVPVPMVRQFWFWPVLRAWPLDFTATHVWQKPNGQSNEHYERIFERNGQKVCRCWRVPIINYPTLPEWTPHPTQKPLSLMKNIVGLTQGDILDPFMGSGTTGVACMNLGRRFIGVEIEPRYFEIACERIENAQRQLRMFA